MNKNKLIANIVFGALLFVSAFISWRVVDMAGDLAFSGEQPSLLLTITAFFISIILVCIAIYIKAKYGK